MLGYGPYREITDNKPCKPRPIIRNPNNLPILLCCDLNAKSGPTYKYDKKLNKMVFDYGFECYKRLTDEFNSNIHIYGIDGGLSFESLYKRALRDKEPPFTTWKERRSEDTMKIDVKSPKKSNNRYDIDDINSIGNIGTMKPLKSVTNVFKFDKQQKELLQQSEGEISKHTIDYMFAKGDAWEITHHLEIPDIKTQFGKALLPDWHYPSDHFSLGIRLKWKKKNDTK